MLYDLTQVKNYEESSEYLRISLTNALLSSLFKKLGDLILNMARDIKEAPSVKIQAFCSCVNKKTVFILYPIETLTIKCKRCGRSLQVISPEHVICGTCGAKMEVDRSYHYECRRCGSTDIEYYEGWFYRGLLCRKCDAHTNEIDYVIDYYYFRCPVDGKIARGMDNKPVTPLDLSNIKLKCGICDVEMTPSDKSLVIIAQCIGCGKKRLIPGQKILDTFVALCAKCNNETDWVETERSIACLNCGTVRMK